MSKISKIELFHVSIPLEEPVYPAWIPGYPQTHNRFTLIRLTTDDGLIGLGAGPAFEDERQGLGSLIGPYLLGLDADDIESVCKRIREAGYLGWRNNWIEAAFWDLKGKISGKPVYRLLQRVDEEVKEVDVYASTAEVRDMESRKPYLDEIRRTGFRAVKIRVHSFNEADDLDIVEKVRREVGPNFGLMADANQGWPVSIIEKTPIWDLERAIRFLQACEELGVIWVEEPLDQHAYDELAELRSKTRTPVAGGELNAGWHEFKVMLEKGSLEIYQPDATLAGGVSAAQRVMEACSEQNLGFTPHTWTNGLGFLVNLQIFAACEERTYLEYPYEPPGWVPQARDRILEEPISVSSRGTVAVPQDPGLGIRLNEEALRRYGKRFYTLTKGRLVYQTIRSKGIKTAFELGRKKK